MSDPTTSEPRGTTGPHAAASGGETHGSAPATEPESAVATAEPPAKPPAPPATGVAAPEPGRKRGAGCWLMGLVLVLAVGLTLGLWWLLARRTAPQEVPVTSSSAFDAAMTKAMVKSPSEPAQPIELSTVQARGTHSFEATFTPEEISALVNAFHHDVVVGNTKVSLSDVKIGSTPEGGLYLSGKVTAGDSSYSGKVSGDVAFQNGQVVAAGPLTVEAEGFSVPDAQAQTATQLLLAYVNGYLAAAPGLTITSAEVGSGGVHVVGLAPDKIDF